MSERRTMFQRIIGGSKGKGKQCKGSHKHPALTEEREGTKTKKRAITPPDTEGTPNIQGESEGSRIAIIEREGRRSTPGLHEGSGRRSATPGAPHERSPFVGAWEDPEEYRSI